MEKMKYYKFQDEDGVQIFVNNSIEENDLAMENGPKICKMEGVAQVLVLDRSEGAHFLLRKFTAEGFETTIAVKEAIRGVLFADYLGLCEENQVCLQTLDALFDAEVLDREQGEIKLRCADVSAVAKRGNDLFLETSFSGYVRFVKFVGYADVEQEGVDICTEEGKEEMSVNFVELRSEGAVNVRTYERGVEVKSSITGSVVSAIAASFKYQPHKTSFTVNTPEGCFEVNFEKIKQGEYRHIALVGAIKMAFDAEFSV